MTTTAETDEKWWTPERVAEELPRFTAAWVRVQLRTGKLRGTKIGGAWFVEPAAVEEMMAAGSNATTRRRRRRAS